MSAGRRQKKKHSSGRHISMFVYKTVVFDKIFISAVGMFVQKLMNKYNQKQFPVGDVCLYDWRQISYLLLAEKVLVCNGRNLHREPL